MKREIRYLILKHKDIDTYLDHIDRELLDDLARKINRGRLLAGKEILHCAVVEHDWPEYEQTWLAIEKRVDGALP